MNNRYIAFDVETPNHANNRMSAIGITVIEDGKIVDELGMLVNPDAVFDRFNVELTGITPAMVKNEPSFPEIWDRLEPVMSSGLLIAHSAVFDMGVLAKCLNHYGIRWREFAYYACTCSMGRACYPGIENHRLNTLCRYLDIPLNHHNAASDSRACAQLLLNYIDNGINTDNYIRRYNLAGTYNGRYKARS